MRERIITIWAGLDARQRVGLVVLAGAVLVGLLYTVFGQARPQYTPLFTDLTPSDAGAIVAKLKAAKVSYVLSQGGTTIEVPQDKVYELRLQMAQEGLPGNSQIGFELFDKSALPGTEFSNTVNYQRALQGELSRSIAALQEVTNARVHLALPKASLFADREQATASVVLDVKPQAQLTNAQVRGIVHLVSSAVENLKPGNVTVLTTRGEFLAGGEAGDEGGGQLSQTQLESQRQFEEQLRRRLQSMLDTAVGLDRSVVRVRAQLDFASEQTEAEIVEPIDGKQGLISKESTSEEEYTGAKPSQGGTAGVSGNLNPRAAISSGQQGTYISRSQQREYQYSRNVKRAKKAPGSVKQIMVAAVVDESVSNVSNEQLTSLLSAAAGADQARGDKVVVERMEMASKLSADEEQKQAAAAEESARRARLIGGFARYGLPAALVMFGLAAALARRRRERIAEPPLLVSGSEGGLPEEQQALPMAAEDESSAFGEAWTLPDIDLESAEVAQLEEYLRQVAEARAEAIARQVQALLEGDGRR